MIEKRDYQSLGRVQHGWLDARHHFSFGSYHDPARMGWGPIRVWNDDIIAPKSGFPTHGHRDMEIITFVREGAITHRDSLGNEGRTAAGDVQVMSAGDGVQHSEYNLEDAATRLFQIWIEPRASGGAPRWDAKAFPKDSRANSLAILASGFAEDIAAGALEIRTDARLYGASLAVGAQLTHPVQPASHLYLVVSRGAVRVNGIEAGEGDALAISEEAALEIAALAADSQIVIAETQAG
jgi:hypothetical protein